MIDKLRNAHQQGWKVKKIAEYLGITEPKAHEQMNVYLHAKYGSRVPNG